MKKENLIRQADIIPLESLAESVTIIGAGAIGSWVALALAKMGMERITVLDHDKVSKENFNSQFYPLRMLEEKKVYALQDMVALFTGTKINAVLEKYTGQCAFDGIVISAVDSMDVRRVIWEKHKKDGLGTSLLIDPRMGAETALLYAVEPKLDESYPNSLYTDEEAVQAPCTARATVYTANLLAGLVCKCVKDWITKQPRYLCHAAWDIAKNDVMLFTRERGKA